MSGMKLLAGITASPVDPRDYPYVSPFKPEQLSGWVDMRHLVYEIEDQGDIGSCVANGICSQCELIGKQNGVKDDLSRMFLYSATKAYSGRLGQEGLYLRNAYKVARRYGMPLESSYPYDLGLDNIDPPSDIYEAASHRKVDKFEVVVSPRNKDYDLAVHNIKSALEEGIVVGIGMPITKSLFDFQGPFSQHEYDLEGPDVPNIGGHFMVIVGYDDMGNYFIVQNSWGEDWGNKGYGALPFDIVKEFFFEAYAIRSFNGMGMPEEPGIKLEWSGRFSAQARIVPKPSEIGEKVKIWVGGVFRDQAFIKPPVHHKPHFLGFETDFSGGTDKWIAVEDHQMLPVIENYEIREDNPIRIISWRDMTEFAGAKIYVSYGTGTVFGPHLQEVFTIPEDL